MADIFAESSVTETASVLESLVGEGKKFKDVESLARGKTESDAYIAQLKAELATSQATAEEAKRDRDSRKSVEELVTKALASKVPVPSSETPNPASPETKTAIPDSDLNERIRAALESRTQEEVVQNNVTSVANELVRVYGSEQKAAEVIKQKAAELKVSPKFLQSTAATSPEAFYSLIGLKANESVRPNAPRGDVNTEGFRKVNSPSQHAPGTYEAIRDQYAGTDVKKLMDPTYLNLQMAEALKNPDKFFANLAP